jgi:hypothetical protein
MRAATIDLDTVYTYVYQETHMLAMMPMIADRLESCVCAAACAMTQHMQLEHIGMPARDLHCN